MEALTGKNDPWIGLLLSLVEDKAFHNDRDIVKAIVKECGVALKFASITLQNDDDIVRTAIKTDIRAWQYASQELRSNRDFVMQAIKEEERLHELRNHLAFVDPIFSEDKEIVRLSIEKGCSPLYKASAALKDDFDIVKSAVIEAAYRWDAYDHDACTRFCRPVAFTSGASLRLRLDPEMVKVVIESNRCWSEHFHPGGWREMERMQGRTDGEILLSFLKVNRQLSEVLMTNRTNGSSKKTIIKIKRAFMI